MILSCQGISKSFGEKVILNDASFHIEEREKAALIGNNGAGKTTLLRIIMNEISADSGQVVLMKDKKIGYLAQYQDVSGHRTVYEELLTTKQYIIDMEDRMRAIEVQMKNASGEELDRLMNTYTRLTHEFELENGYAYKSELMGVLKGLGFTDEDFAKQVETLSGGQKTRVALGKLLISKPDILLLDEPTNHLDIESIQWLETFLKQKANVVVLVSHDRAFIDNVTNRTLEISCGKVYDYQVNYSKYVVLHQERIEQQMRAYENQQKQIQQTERFIERFRYKATKSVQVQSRIKQLEKIEEIEVDEVDNSRLNLKFPPAPRSGDYPVICEGVAKKYGDHTVFSNVDLTIKRGEKVAFVGKNGEGKSTLVKCIMNEIPYDGNLKIGHNVKIGYFAQNQASLLDGEITVFDTIDQVAVGDIRTKIRDILGAFMFGGEASDKKVKVLSGGEKTRLAMIRLLLEPVNLLILDEPTNHLDMKIKDVLKQAIADFDGTVIVVSHDRDFLDGLVEKVYEFGGGKVREHLGGIYDFLQHKQMESLRELEKSVPSKTDNDQIQEPAVSSGKQSYAEKKEFEKQIRKAERLVKDAEAKVSQLEAELKVVEDKLAAGATDNDLFERHGEVSKSLDAAMSEWEDATMELENLKNN